MSTTLEFKEKIKLIKKGSVKQAHLTDEERVQAQYELGRYSKHSLNFLYSLKNEEIDVAFHMNSMYHSELLDLLKVVKERNLDISKVKEDKDLVVILLEHESKVGANWFTPKERAEIFNEKFNNYQADALMNGILEKGLDFEKKIEFTKNKFNNLYYPRDFIEKYKKNIDEFASKVDLDLIKSHGNYEAYLRQSPQFLYFLKQVVTMKGLDFSELFETMKPILPIPEKESYKDILLAAMFNQGYHHVAVNDENILDKFADYMKENKLKINVNKRDTINQGYLDEKHIKNAPQFMQMLFKSSPSLFKEIATSVVSKNLSIEHNEYVSALNINDFSKKVNELKSLIQAVRSIDSEFTMDKAVTEPLLEKNLTKIKEVVKRNETIKSFQEELNNLSSKEKKIYSILINNIKFLKDETPGERAFKIDKHIFKALRDSIVTPRVQDLVSAFLDEEGKLKVVEGISIKGLIEKKIKGEGRNKLLTFKMSDEMINQAKDMKIWPHEDTYDFLRNEVHNYPEILELHKQIQELRNQKNLFSKLKRDQKHNEEIEEKITPLSDKQRDLVNAVLEQRDAKVHEAYPKLKEITLPAQDQESSYSQAFYGDNPNADYYRLLDFIDKKEKEAEKKVKLNNLIEAKQEEIKNLTSNLENLKNTGQIPAKENLLDPFNYERKKEPIITEEQKTKIELEALQAAVDTVINKKEFSNDFPELSFMLPIVKKLDFNKEIEQVVDEVIESETKGLIEFLNSSQVKKVKKLKA